MPLRTSAKGGCKETIARITNEYTEDIWAPLVGFPFSWNLLSFLFFFFLFVWNVHLDYVGSEYAPLRSVESRTTYDTRCQCPWYCCSIAMARCRVPSKRGVPSDRRWSQPTYGPRERRASYVNMKSLAKRAETNRAQRRRKKKKSVQREKFSQVATSPGAQRRKKMPIVQRCTPLHRSLISKFSLKIAVFFSVFPQKFANFARMLLNFRQM